MKAIIPVAGMGTRLRPHTHTCPKVLLPVAGKPIIAHILDELAALNFDEITFILGHKGSMIREYVTREYGFKANFVKQEEMRGLGHAISLARAFHADDEDVFIVLGDTIFKADLQGCFERGESALGVKEVADPRRFGVVEFKADGEILRLVEKPSVPPSNLALCGLYYLRSPKLLFDCLDEMIANDVRTAGEFQLTDALQMMLDRGCPMSVFKIDGWYDCGKKETVLQTNRDLLDMQQAAGMLGGGGYTCTNSTVIAPVAIHPSVTITNSVIGPYVTISAETAVESCVIADSTVGESCELANLLLEQSLIGDNCRVIGERQGLNIGDSSELLFAK